MLLKDKVDRRVFILLWAVVLFRLLIVDSLNSSVSFAQFLPSTQSMTDYLSFAQVQSDITNLPKEAAFIMEQNNTGLNSVTQIQPLSITATDGNIPWLFTIWLVGATAMFTVTVVLYLLFQYKKSKNIIYLPDIGYEKELGNVKAFLSDQVTSPVTIGIFKPQIHLPVNIDFRDKEMVRHVLIHEMIHIKRYDNLLKLVMLATLSLHWFNPFVWLLCRTLNKDIECSCDASTLAQLGEEKKSDYANTLVTMAERSNDANIAGLVFASFESSILRERVLNIMTKKYPAFLSIILATVFSSSIFMVFATDANAIKTIDHTSFNNISLLLEKKEPLSLPLEKNDPPTVAKIQIEKNENVKSTIYNVVADKPIAEKNIAPEENNHPTTFDGIQVTPDQKTMETIPVIQPEVTAIITFEQASAIALRFVGGGEITKWELDRNKKSIEYEFEIISDTAKYELEIDAYTGEILEYESKKRR